jgi:hypothetical protein
MKITFEALRTFRNAALVGAMMFSSLAGYAAIAGGPEPVKIHNDAQRFMSAGLYNSDSRLAQELNLLHPVGSDAGSLLNRLSRGGFECQADMRSPGNYDCVFNRPLSFQRVARLETRVATDGLRIIGISPNLVVTPAPTPQPSFGLQTAL